jgi:replicative DNA helicase
MRFPELLDSVLDGLPHGSNPELPQLPTGLRDLDRLLGSLTPGTVHLVAGPPGVGVTALLLTLLSSIAGQPGGGAVYVAGHPSRQELVRRLLAMGGAVDAHSLRAGTLSEEERTRMHMAVDRLRSWPLEFIDRPSPEDGRVRAAASRVVTDTGSLQLLIIDDPTGPASDDGPVDPGGWVKLASRLAEEFDATAFVACHALPLSPDGRDLMTPAAYTRLSRWSTIQRHVDAVWMLHRPEMYDPNSPDRGLGELKLLSNRLELPEATIRLTFLAHRASWTSP